MSLSVEDVDFGEQKIIYVTAPDYKEKTYGVEWTIPATECLLKYIKRYLKLFETGKLRTKKQLYENVSAAMEEKGMFYSGAQCENKWKSLKRSYITRYERGNTSTRRFSVGKLPYESQVEEILKIDKPAFKKELEMQSLNLNVPPGFTKSEPESYSENEEDSVPVYTDQDAELVQMVLRDKSSADGGPKGNNLTKFVEYVSSQSDKEEHNYSYSTNLEGQASRGFEQEIFETKKILKRNLATTTEVLRNHNATHEQILTYLDTLEKREEEKMEIKRRKISKQDEIIQQLKIQNSLIAKLIQKLVNKPA